MRVFKMMDIKFWNKKENKKDDIIFNTDLLDKFTTVQLIVLINEVKERVKKRLLNNE